MQWLLTLKAHNIYYFSILIETGSYSETRDNN